MSGTTITARRIAAAGVALLVAMAIAVVSTVALARRSMASGDVRSLAIAQFLGVADVEASAWRTVDVDGVARDESTIAGVGLVQLDATTHEVRETIWDARLTTAPGTNVPEAAAVETGRAFAASRYAGFAGLAARGAELLDHGTFREYRVTWQARAGQAWLPSRVTVGVNAATGDVAYYASERRTVTVPTIPVVGATAAVATARGATGRPDGHVDVAELNVVDENGSQHLVWVVRLSGGATVGKDLVIPQIDVVEVDALTGAATIQTR